MNVEKPKRVKARASSDCTFKWNSINWTIIEMKVKKLQSRIAKAVSKGRINLVKKLQYLLSKSFYAKLLAVKKVTTNKGKNTPGVDGVIWNSDSSKLKGVLSLSNKGYKAVPLKRTYIKKSNGKQRPLGIPTMYDRAMQALHLLTLDPVSESTLEKTSYGFRKFRSTKDACSQLFTTLSRRNAPKWVLEGDIRGCFDNISHKWMQDNIIVNKKVLYQFLKSGYVYRNKLYPTKTGSPQGGIISPVFANLTLDGIATMLKEKYWTNKKGTINVCYNKRGVNITVYADDFVVTAKAKETLIEIKMMIEEFLKERGLELSEEKTVITHIDNGFDFLGWNFRKYNNKLLIKPSKESLKRIKKKIKETVRINLMQKQEVLIIKLNQIIRGWCNYHKHACSKKIFCSLDDYIFKLLWKWAKRRHPMKSASWKKNRYFVRIDHRDWIFKSEKERLVFAGDFKIKRHIQIKSAANPYLNEYNEYYSKRRKGLLLIGS